MSCVTDIRICSPRFQLFWSLGFPSQVVPQLACFDIICSSMFVTLQVPWLSTDFSVLQIKVTLTNDKLHHVFRKAQQGFCQRLCSIDDHPPCNFCRDGRTASSFPARQTLKTVVHTLVRGPSRRFRPVAPANCRARQTFRARHNF